VVLIVPAVAVYESYVAGTAACAVPAHAHINFTPLTVDSINPFKAGYAIGGIFPSQSINLLVIWDRAFSGYYIVNISLTLICDLIVTILFYAPSWKSRADHCDKSCSCLNDGLMRGMFCSLT
jgi:hypothetical protein